MIIPILQTAGVMRQGNHKDAVAFPISGRVKVRHTAYFQEQRVRLKKMPMTTIKAIEARLPVTDVKASAAFYSDILGLDVSLLWPDDLPTFAILSSDGLRLQLERREGSAAGSCTLCFDVSDALSMYSKVKDKVKIDWGPEVYFYHRREFAFRDPDGHAVIVSEVTSDPVTCQQA